MKGIYKLNWQKCAAILLVVATVSCNSKKSGGVEAKDALATYKVADGFG